MIGAGGFLGSVARFFVMKLNDRVDWLALWTKALDAGRQVRADSGDVTYAPPGKVNHMRA